MNSFKKILVVATLAGVIIAGCSKDKKNDTPDPVPPTNKELLTAKTWQIGETYQNVTGTRIHYLRGGENTSGVNMGVIKLKFNSDGTGTNTDISGTTYNMTWSFTSSDETNLRLTVNGSVIYDWYFVDIEADFLFANTNVSTDGLVTARWIPVP